MQTTPEPKTSSAGETWQVGGCRVDPAANRVSCDARRVHLEPRSMEVLVHLIENAGQVVSRDRLQTAIWGDVTVGDESLTNAIIKIRKALGDDARNPRYIETIPKRGYRLIASVTPAVPHSPQPAAATAVQDGRRGMWRLAALGAVLVALVVAAVLVAPRLGAPGAGTGADRGTQTPAAGSIRVAVTPFLNLGGERARDYLVRGIEETVINRLSGQPGVTVLHRPDGANPTADFLLEGAVLAARDRLRVTLRLLDAGTGAVLANEKLEQPIGDLLAMERAIEARIVQALALDIEQADLARRASGYTDSTEAFDLFLQAQAALLTRSRQGNRRAQALYRRAIAQDPRFARAYGGLALSLAADYRNGWADDPQAALDQALSMAQTALEIAPDLPEQLWVIGYVRTQQRNFAAARQALARALALRPDYADAHALLGGIATYDGAPERSVALLRRAIRLRPQAGYLYYLLLGRAYYYLGDCQQAEINLVEALSRNADNIEAHLYHAACLHRQGQGDDADWELQEVYALDPGFALQGFFDAYPLANRAQRERLRGDLRAAGFR